MLQSFATAVLGSRHFYIFLRREHPKADETAKLLLIIFQTNWWQSNVQKYIWFRFYIYIVECLWQAHFESFFVDGKRHSKNAYDVTISPSAMKERLLSLSTTFLPSLFGPSSQRTLLLTDIFNRPLVCGWISILWTKTKEQI